MTLRLICVRESRALSQKSDREKCLWAGKERWGLLEWPCSSMAIEVKWCWMQPADHGKVLVIANEQSQRQSLSRSLQGRGYEMVEAGTDTAIERVVDQVPDLVILDLAPKLPIEQDLALCPRIKAAAGDEVPVIVISG